MDKTDRYLEVLVERLNKSGKKAKQLDRSAKLDLTPLLALSDSWFRTNLLRGYKPPADPTTVKQQNADRRVAIENAIAKSVADWKEADRKQRQANVKQKLDRDRFSLDKEKNKHYMSLQDKKLRSQLDNRKLYFDHKNEVDAFGLSRQDRDESLPLIQETIDELVPLSKQLRGYPDDDDVTDLERYQMFDAIKRFAKDHDIHIGEAAGYMMEDMKHAINERKPKEDQRKRLERAIGNGSVAKKPTTSYGIRNEYGM